MPARNSAPSKRFRTKRSGTCWRRAAWAWPKPRNSIPTRAPLHVLQLANELGLSDAQRKATDSLYANMRQRALSIGRQIIEAERTLDRAFANAAIEPAALRSQVGAIATLQGELRAVHLEAHLAQRALLTLEQIARYDALRGYRGSPAPHDSRHGG